MFKLKALFASTTFVLFFAGSLFAQSGTVSSGDKATGSGGSVHYTVGQVVYVPATGGAGTLSQGIQQPFIIEAITAIDQDLVDLSFNFYPNPVSDFLILTIEREIQISDDSFYSVFDIRGKLLKKGKIEGSQTQIPMKEFGSSTYLIKTYIDNSEVKTFRVIKN